jgi:hypothetical protein
MLSTSRVADHRKRARQSGLKRIELHLCDEHVTVVRQFARALGDRDNRRPIFLTPEELKTLAALLTSDDRVLQRIQRKAAALCKGIGYEGVGDASGADPRSGTSK